MLSYRKYKNIHDSKKGREIFVRMKHYITSYLLRDLHAFTRDNSVVHLKTILTFPEGFSSSFAP